MDESGVVAAYARYAPSVYARCHRLLRDREGARDVTQEVFVRCFSERRSLRPGTELLAWLYRVATNLCLNLLRARRIRLAAQAERPPPAAVSAPDQTHDALQLLEGLDARTQEVAIYVYVDGMTQAEAAAVAGVSDRTVRNCLGRFVAHGRKLLALDKQETSDEELSFRIRSGRR
jgi:RNA polymerase sigma-70 factor (ECF subfamily)